MQTNIKQMSLETSARTVFTSLKQQRNVFLFLFQMTFIKKKKDNSLSNALKPEASQEWPPKWIARVSLHNIAKQRKYKKLYGNERVQQLEIRRKKCSKTPS